MSDQTKVEILDAEQQQVFSRIGELVTDVLTGRTDLADAIGLTDADLEVIYSLGYGFYNAGQYDDALTVFRFLCLHRYTDKRFWFGLGATAQMKGEDEFALRAYAMSGLIDEKDPQVPLRAAEVMIRKGDKQNARAALEATISIADQAQNGDTHARRARVLLEELDSAA